MYIYDYWVSVLSEQHALQYDNKNLSRQQLVLFSLRSVDIQPTIDSSASKQTRAILNLIRRLR